LVSHARSRKLAALWGDERGDPVIHAHEIPFQITGPHEAAALANRVLARQKVTGTLTHRSGTPHADIHLGAASIGNRSLDPAIAFAGLAPSLVPFALITGLPVHTGQGEQTQGQGVTPASTLRLELSCHTYHMLR
jgi:hypothetical protein